ncbi:hypothetical protein DWY78_05295 [Ruminococcus sp. AF27-12AA]|nr:hypothetical protein DWY85_12735 [Ruminococcus sp. AF27-3]RGG08450.1 hypothetical protein DWY75_10785 [Ruminococcus sp. AF27-11AA]RGG11614.1 hypothetical protein DWY78_05295 [Ruminococcus sp. AF27-12AA]
MSVLFRSKSYPWQNILRGTSSRSNEWNWINNYVLVDPDEITEKYSTNVWWICKRNPDHVYELSVSEKILYKKRHRESCPYCKGRRRKKRLF